MQAFLKSGKLGESTEKASTSSAIKKPQRKQQWVEKYRPKTVEDIVQQRDAVAVLQECIKGADLPNFLFYGPPGTGKTSTILAAAHQLFGDLYRDRILELNASDERGIQVIREKIKTFSQITVGGTRNDGTPCPALKIVILDEADAMTHAAQAALRRTMEKETKSTRFCLLCNYVSRIIEPLTSRCTKFRFKPLNEEFILKRLQYIAEHENVQITDEVLQAMVEASGGDMRRAITALQSCFNLKGKEGFITLESVHEVLMVVPKTIVSEFMDICRRPPGNDTHEKRENLKKIMDFVKKLSREAYPTQKILEIFNDVLIESNDFTNMEKGEIGEYISEVAFRNAYNKVDFIHLVDLAVNIQYILSVPFERRQKRSERDQRRLNVAGV